ncbi:MAG: FkbM family methyltransferase [Burkholderiales bacterium]|nr:FkbM family methyltransferase [Burkholderiales bacterium]
MNPIWFYRNLIECWRYKASLADFIKRMRWVYAKKHPINAVPKQQEIGFLYPSPIGGIRLAVRANDGSDSFIFGEVFQHNYYRLGLPTQPKTILDVGANTGFTAVYFARTYTSARLACVEPIPANVRVLRRNLELNAVTADVFPVAITVEDGRVLMEILAKDYGHRIFDGTSSARVETLEVDALSIKTIQKRLGWSRIGLLKVDIEGYEKKLFSADCSWLWLVDAMCIECHEGFGEADLERIAAQFDFLSPLRLPGIWLLRRR